MPRLSSPTIDLTRPSSACPATPAASGRSPPPPVPPGSTAQRQGRV